MIDAEIERFAFQWRRVARFRPEARRFPFVVDAELVAAFVTEDVRRRRRRYRALQQRRVRAVACHNSGVATPGVAVAAAAA